MGAQCLHVYVSVVDFSKKGKSLSVPPIFKQFVAVVRALSTKLQLGSMFNKYGGHSGREEDIVVICCYS